MSRDPRGYRNQIVMNIMVDMVYNIGGVQSNVGV
jgi:hypothetical protein